MLPPDESILLKSAEHIWHRNTFCGAAVALPGSSYVGTYDVDDVVVAVFNFRCRSMQKVRIGRVHSYLLMYACGQHGHAAFGWSRLHYAALYTLSASPRAKACHRAAQKRTFFLFCLLLEHHPLAFLLDYQQSS